MESYSTGTFSTSRRTSAACRSFADMTIPSDRSRKVGQDRRFDPISKIKILSIRP